MQWDAMYTGMRLRVEADYFGRSMVRIVFANQGKQIPDDIRKRIFDPFFTTKKNGTGLGLSITTAADQGSARRNRAAGYKR